MRGDPHRLKQVITNLVGNAIKFTQSGGINLMARFIGTTGEQAVEFSVVDTGIGIAADKLERLFQRFSQVDVSTTRKYGGTGLGLALCRELLELMKGEIWCESTEGQGSAFRFLLPIAVVPAAVRAKLESERRRLAGRSLLVVGAGTASRAVLKAYADVSGWSLEHASSADALAAVGLTRRFDCIVLAGTTAGETGSGVDELRRTYGAPDCAVVRLAAASGPRATTEPGVLLLAQPVVAATYQALRKVMPARAQARTEKPARGGGLKILLVEDNPSNQMVATLMLKTAGYAIEVAEHGAAAVEMVGQREFDVILMDLHMPVMDGIEATKRIRAQEGRQFTPIIGLTASSLKSDRQACLDAGMTDHMSKPVDWNALIAILRQIEKQTSSASAA